MANSTSANLKLTVQATGENSGTWGQITNTNLIILEQAIGGYTGVALNATTGATLVFSDGVVSNGKNKVLKLTGTISGNVDVVIPNNDDGDPPQKTYIVENATSGAFTVTLKTQSGTGVTWSATDKGKKIVYTDGTNVVEGITSTGNITTGNITTGAITGSGHIIPGANDTYDLGAVGNVWRNIYTGDLHLSNRYKEKGNIVDGTKGNWTLQEGEKDIFMINNISGEKFKINLSKIEGDS
jgi:hypothetical protein